MKKIFLSLFVLLSQLTFAQKKSLLWEISGNGLDKPSYLYGTIHLLCEKDFVLSEKTKVHFAEAEQVVLELDMDDPKMMVDMMQSMYMKNNMTLKKLLSEADYGNLERYFKDSVGMNLAIFNNAKPFVLMSMLYKNVMNCPIQSYEMTFTEMAKKEKKEVYGLESVKDQMAIFDEIPYEKQAEAMMKLIKQPAQSDNEFDKMVALYKSQNIKKMAKLSAKSDFEFKDYESQLLDNRNAKWIDKIGTFSHQKSTFFAVGAAHLGGRKGVVKLLQKAGYQVKPIY